MNRYERQYRAIIDRHERGNWQTQTATLIGLKWAQLTTIDDHLRTRINDHLTKWKSSEK
ncbi:hypothetical protein [Spirosoma utsteinense]|uniref:Uncharacterized protein n=1 Tax=Spirosoma utsteinense TaxID=2585773 RepID=A0ABR6W8Q6_9BACT|nr:hypothetical protein [Spirosoma utsteinense]MBC3787260.1 hypothetical protein [Spirosoma utsteinense]MBC3792945.1 hypothetical protein [Spirosoma utsteinense]